jgi:hypothetical protein
MKEFDYYIYIDYSENLIGYAIIEKTKFKDLLPKITRFAHYKELKQKSSYIHKIRNKNQNMEIYLDVFEFLKNHSNCIIFISIDNHEYSNFIKFVKIIEGNKVVIKKESQLLKGTSEYQASLVLDTILNIERLKENNA